MSKLLGHWINGQMMEGASGSSGDVFNPATGELSTKVPFASSEEVDKAVSAARSAAPEWAATPPI